MNAVITGATKGMGHAITKALVEKGYNVAVSARKMADLESLKTELLSINPNIEIILFAGDFSLQGTASKFAWEIRQQWKQINLLVNNLGMFTSSDMLTEEDAVLMQQMQVNVFSAYSLTKGLVNELKASQGHIFFTSSIAGIAARKGAGAYSVSKYAVKGLADNFREALRVYQVKVTTLIPGETLTASWEGTDIPPEKFILPEDIANAVLGAINTSKGALIEEIKIMPINLF